MPHSIHAVITYCSSPFLCPICATQEDQQQVEALTETVDNGIVAMANRKQILLDKAGSGLKQDKLSVRA